MSEEEYYHVRITTKSDRGNDEVKLDLSIEQISERFLIPYENGIIIIINGKSIEPDDIERININRTNDDSSILIPRIRAEKRASGVCVPISDEWYVTEKGEDVTDEFILGPPGYKKPSNTKDSNGTGAVEAITKNNRVFIVHGHDEEMKHAVARSLKKLNLEPIILHEQPNRGKIIIEKFEDYSENIPFAIVLLSPDDKGCEANDFPKSAKLRARQNIILELGYFIGKLGRSKVLVLLKNEADFEPPSDIMGVLYTLFKDGWELEMIRELQSCGYDVDANNLV